jgi:hypothetical protein
VPQQQRIHQEQGFSKVAISPPPTEIKFVEFSWEQGAALLCKSRHSPALPHFV